MKSSGFSLFESFLSTFFAFALPGQFVMADMLLAGGNLLNIFLAVLLTNARLFPMTINIMPLIKQRKTAKWKYYFVCHLVAVTAWINMFASYKRIKKKNRFEYFLGLGGTLWLTSVLFTVLGFLCSNFVSENILVGMVFLNPMYFLIMTLTHIINKKLTIILIISFITGPLFYFYLDNWGILISGFMSGTVGFYFFKGKKI